MEEMSGFSDRNKNGKGNMDDQRLERLEKEEKLFRAMSGVDEELLLRSEQCSSKPEGKVRKFPIKRMSRIVAACLCFVVAGAMFVAVRDSVRRAGSTGSDTAAPQMAYSVAEAYDTDAVQPENEAAGRVADAEEVMPEAVQAEMADSARADAATAMDSGAGWEQAQQNPVSEESAEVAEDVPVGKAGRCLQKKMTKRGQ